ncbi:MAG TPA: C13 family peptidase [Ideonella sp.]|uniref:C13 family peptidase n=1 Tax=Ideonella sp. TaxID=1929293 RepID=UPI002BE7D79E|nr:C13 family peptidase [Ideonella sp.]HSI51294.1 C13 family peptidase [Ideonella sp.]
MVNEASAGQGSEVPEAREVPEEASAQLPVTGMPKLPLLPRGALGAWWAQGLRAALLLRPSGEALPLSAAILLLLWLIGLGAELGLARLFIDGPARFYWPALLMNPWMGLVVSALAAWLAVRNPAAGPGEVLQQAGARLALLCALTLPLALGSLLVLVPLIRGIDSQDEQAVALVQWVSWIWMGWVFAAQGRLLWRGGTAGAGSRLAAVLLLVGSQLLLQFYQPVHFWYPQRPPAQTEADKEPPFSLTQEVFEAQDDVLANALDAVPPQHPGKVDVYAITFAPNADEEVFRRESHMVAEVMQKRYGAAPLELINQREDTPDWPWATPINLARAIQRAGEQMDVDEDVLFIHLTSHGGRDGELATAFWPLDVDSVTPQDLKSWLNEAGIKHAVISISACFSGSWIAPLADDNTLVMTAADADHTSYGCGRRSPLTFFGRAMYDENIRAGMPFEAAHAKAREVIAQREKEAGKDDGYSNPQIAMGARMREKLAELEKQQAGGR